MSTEPKLEPVTEETRVTHPIEPLQTRSPYLSSSTQDSRSASPISRWVRSASPSMLVWVVVVVLVGVGGLWLFVQSLDPLSAPYQLVVGNSSIHSVTQLCTLTLFFGGIGALLSRLLELRIAKRQLATLEIESHSLCLLTPFLYDFVVSAERGVRSAQSEAERRETLIAARDRALDEVDVMKRGALAVMWLLPLSGFLGTVIGMSQTIGRFDQLFSASKGDAIIGLAELAPAIQGLSTAFDTTLLALALVIPLKLVIVFFESAGDQLIIDIERSFGELLLSSVREERGRPEAHNALEERLAYLTVQAEHLNRHLSDSSTLLIALREALGETQGLTHAARAALIQDVSIVLRESLQQIKAGERSQVNTSELSALLHMLERQGAERSAQLEAVRVALEAPLTLSRALSSTHRG